jgi:hypothetical protein
MMGHRTLNVEKGGLVSRKQPPALSTLLLFLMISISSLSVTLAGDEWGEEEKPVKHRANVRSAFLASMPVASSSATGFFEGAASFCSGMGCVPLMVILDMEAEAQSAFGLMLGLEWLLFQERVGVELDGYFMKKILGFNGSFNGWPFEGDLDGYMLTVCLNYHFRPREKTDFYAGPLFAPGIKETGTDEIESDIGLAFGGNVGADYHLNSRFSFSVNLRYVDFGKIDVSYVAESTGEGIHTFEHIVSDADLSFMALTFAANLNF